MVGEGEQEEREEEAEEAEEEEEAEAEEEEEEEEEEEAEAEEEERVEEQEQGSKAEKKAAEEKAEGAQIRQRVENSLLEEMDMIELEGGGSDAEEQNEDAMGEIENNSEDEGDERRDEGGEEQRQDDDSVEGGVGENDNSPVASGQKNGQRRVSFADPPSRESAAQNLENSLDDGNSAASSPQDHASASGSFGNNGSDLDHDEGAHGTGEDDGGEGASKMAQKVVKSEKRKMSSQVCGFGQVLVRG